MKNLAILMAIVVFLTLLFTQESFTQKGIEWKGGGGWGVNGQYWKKYNPKTVETVIGKVIDVDAIIPLKGMSRGIHVIVNSEKEEIAIHAGPAWYIENQETKIQPNDEIEVTGSRVNFEEKPVIIAAEIKKDGEVLSLRDTKGVPLWSGWKKYK
ncbi:MAG: DNA-binding protein [Candidatus Kuenenia sp.]|nr:DNA-binding protein [Candidatus Kuenenia hertensis]